MPGVTCTIQFSPDLTAWQDLGTVTPTTAAGTYDAVVPAPVPAKGYFRIKLM